MDDKTFSHLPFLQTCNFFGPPEIEKILDTFVTKNNQRYYKVKWVKVCWVGENELSYLSNAVDEFWSQYTQYMQENLLFEPPLDTSNDEIQCNKEIVSNGITDQSIDLRDCESTHVIDSILSDIKSKKVFGSFQSSSTDTNNYIPHFEKADVCPPETTIDFNKQKPEKLPSVLFNTLDDIPADITDSSCNSISNIEIDVESVQKIHCNSCQEPFSSTKELLDHQNSKCKQNGFKCPTCEVEFKNKERLEKHLNSHNIKKCNFCDKEFTRLAHLSTHLLIHENIKPWVCKECDKSFTDKSSLTKHQLVHNGIRKHKCDVCSKSFQRAQHLRRHKETHEGVKNFQCNKCGRKFHLNNSLKVHMNIHTGEKPYKCDVCWRPFADKSALKRHKSIHEYKKPVTCNNCYKEFTRKSSYDIHNCKSSKLSDG